MLYEFVKKNIIALIIMALGILCLIKSNDISVPSDFIYSPYEYVGGDAYNYIIESSLVASEIAATSINQVVYQVGGIICLAIGLSKIKFLSEKEIEKQKNKVEAYNNYTESIIAEVDKQEKI